MAAAQAAPGAGLAPGGTGTPSPHGVADLPGRVDPQIPLAWPGQAPDQGRCCRAARLALAADQLSLDEGDAQSACRQEPPQCSPAAPP